MHDGAPVGAHLRTSHVSSVPLRRREMDLREDVVSLQLCF